MTRRDQLERWLNKRWYTAQPPTWWLLPLSWLFGLVTTIRRMLYRMYLIPRWSAGVPVVVVGNLTVGGSGKTPVVLALADALRARGEFPGIVSRGYGARVPGVRVLHAEDSADAVGDEPALMAGRGVAVVAIGADRVKAARALRRAHPVTVILTDDGLQHYRLKRDCEVVVVDGRRSFGNGALLPAGPLREPRRRLRSVDVVLTSGKPEDGQYGFRLVPGEVKRLGSLSETRPLASFKGQRVHAVAGIGDPRRFFDMLARLGIFVTPHPFPDHHRFVRGDLDFPGDTPILMTEKDAVKCAGIAPDHAWYVPVTAELDPGAIEKVMRRVEERRG